VSSDSLDYSALREVLNEDTQEHSHPSLDPIVADWEDDFYLEQGRDNLEWMTHMHQLREEDLERDRRLLEESRRKTVKRWRQNNGKKEDDGYFEVPSHVRVNGEAAKKGRGDKTQGATTANTSGVKRQKKRKYNEMTLQQQIEAVNEKFL